MFGRIDGSTFLLAISAISLVAAVTDLKYGRIFNWLTLPSLLIGLAASAYFAGWVGLIDGVFGVFAGLVFYGWMFWLGIMGGGDVKFLMALGAWGGFRYVAEVAVLGILVGGAIAVVILTYSGHIFSFGKRFYAFLMALFVKELEFHLPKVDRKLTMPYGVPIAVAAIWVAWSNPLEKMGLSLWN